MLMTWSKEPLSARQATPTSPGSISAVGMRCPAQTDARHVSKLYVARCAVDRCRSSVWRFLVSLIGRLTAGREEPRVLFEQQVRRLSRNQGKPSSHPAPPRM